MTTRRLPHRAIHGLLLAVLLTMLPSPQLTKAQESEQPADPPLEIAPAQAGGLMMVSDTRSFAPRRDAYIASASPNTNYGTVTNLNLGWQAGGQEAMRMLIAFDFSSIPDNAVIRKATLSIYQYAVLPGSDGSMVFQAQQMSQDWSETGVTWNNANYLGGAQLPFGSIPPIIGYISGDVTGLVQSWVSGAVANHGLLVTGDEVPFNNRSRYFSSRESTNAPYITVEYDVACDTLPPVATVLPQPQFQPLEFLVEWNGTDQAPSGCQPSGLANFDVEYRVNFGDWVPWKNRTTATSNHFKGYAPNGSYVELRARATDNAGNIGNYTGTQAATTIDDAPPTASVNPLPEYTQTPNFLVTWGGNDGAGSGIRNFDVQFRVNGGPWQTLIEETSQTSYQVTGAQDLVTYDLRARATDNVGNAGQWPSTPQATTTVFFAPVAAVSPFNPVVIKPTAPITDSFTVNWIGATAPGTSLTSFTVSYQFNNGPWTVWQTFPATQISAVFPWQALGFGDGNFSFNAVARNSLGVTGAFIAPPAVVIVDMADKIKDTYLPLVVGSGN